MGYIVDWLRKHVSQAADLYLDSRDIHEGDVFVACKGSHFDGAHFVNDAIRNGAAAILSEKALAADIDIPVLLVHELRSLLGTLADEWYEHPSSCMTVVAITGTNGKTSCVNWVAQALNTLDIPCASIGTLGVILPNGENLGGALTTPDVLSMHRLLAKLLTLTISTVALEASSIGLEQGRLEGVRIHTAAFTNLTLDHLDYHGSMQVYEQCKAALFMRDDLPYAVINVDDKAGLRYMANSLAHHTIGYSLTGQQQATICAQDNTYGLQGLSFTLMMAGEEAHIETTLVGAHNVENLLLVAGVLGSLGWKINHIAKALSALTAIAGRLEVVKNEALTQALPLVVVDYSHTPDALRQALHTLRPFVATTNGQLHCVFGCGGDRDTSKRPVMGEIAQAFADRVYITSDNPRTEEPLGIINDILSGLHSDVFWHSDRAFTIMHAILKANTNDVVLIAGKGHETYQEIKGQRIAFDDRSWALLALLLKSGASINTDSRTIQAGDIFVALKGDAFDGHQFLVAAEQGKAAAVIVSTADARLTVPQIVVDDTLKAFMQVAKAWRSMVDIPVIAVTGSNGKTTCKEMIAAMLQAQFGKAQCLATQGNLNNHIGVPLSLLKLEARHRAAVFELGMNHPGEIAVLADLTQPTVALVNNAQREHQEFMKTVEAVAFENGSVFSALTADGIAVYPKDEVFTQVWDTLAKGHRVVQFGKNGHVFASHIKKHALGASFKLNVQWPSDMGSEGSQAIDVHLAVPGEHNIKNALAAASSALAVGVSLQNIALGLSAFKAVKGRMESHILPNNTVLIDDSYNANPDSVVAAIDVISTLEKPVVLVLGDMGEVGDDGVNMHKEVGQYAKRKGIDVLLAMGELSKASVEGFGNARHFANGDALVNALKLIPAKTILIKGSRFMKMESVIKALLNNHA